MADILGECPVPSAMKFDGLNDGIGAGRACWMIPNSCCRLEAARHAHRNPCYHCVFYNRVVFEEEEDICFRYSTETVNT